MKFLSFLLSVFPLFCSPAHADSKAMMPPNEMGKIMVLMYHRFESKEAEWVRTPAHFRKDLQNLYDRGYYLINTRDLASGLINVPEGKSPVVLTFDDSATGQIKKLANGKWDPNCAVGILTAFTAAHPDFGRAGSFYVNDWGSSKLPKILGEMIALGYEIGNHTMDHPQLSKLPEAKVKEEIAMLQDYVEKANPGYQITTMALPFGIYPKNTAWAEDGTFNGITYHHSILLEVGSSPSVSPYSKEFNPMHVTRVRGSELDHAKSTEYIDGALAYFDAHPEERFVSDGDPGTVTVPRRLEDEVSKNLPAQLTLKIVNE
jgi:peptidoglycan/xylan/chitin deacetylase (PgdA/CDA1 family)